MPSSYLNILIWGVTDMKENRNMAEKNQVTDNQFQKIVNKVSLITIILNALLSVF